MGDVMALTPFTVVLNATLGMMYAQKGSFGCNKRAYLAVWRKAIAWKVSER